MNKSAFFSQDRKYRFYLYRGWDSSLPTALMIGLNPSTADENTDDPTIRRIKSLLNYNKFGAFYMMNLFPIVSTDPGILKTETARLCMNENDAWIMDISKDCSKVIFCWGNFEVYGRDKAILKLFPGAMTFGHNKNGSPKHPLYLKTGTNLQL